MHDGIFISGFPNGQQEDLGIVSHTKYQFYKRCISIDNIITGAEQEILLALCLTGWLPVPPNLSPVEFLKIFNVNSHQGPAKLVYDAIVSSKVSVEFLLNLLRARRLRSEDFEKIYLKILNYRGLFYTKTVLASEISIVLNKDYKKEVECLVDSLWGITVNGVGQGEICLTLLAGAIKASVGDLELPFSGQKIEVKGVSGKLGPSGAIFAAGTPKRLAEIVGLTKREFREKTFQRKEYHKIQQKEQKELEELRQKREILKLRLQRREYDVQKELFARKRAGKNPIKSTRIAVQNIKAAKHFLKNVSTAHVPSTLIGTSLDPREVRVLKRMYDDLQRFKKIRPENVKVSTCSFRFRHATESFFLDKKYNRGAANLVNGFYNCRNIEMVPNLKENIDEFFFNHPIEYLRSPETLKRLMIALHSYCYWIEDEFTHIHVVDHFRSCILPLPKNKDFTCNPFDFIYNNVSSSIKTDLEIGESQRPSGIEVWVG